MVAKKDTHFTEWTISPIPKLASFMSFFIMQAPSTILFHYLPCEVYTVLLTLHFANSILIQDNIFLCYISSWLAVVSLYCLWTSAAVMVVAIGLASGLNHFADFLHSIRFHYRRKIRTGQEICVRGGFHPHPSRFACHLPPSRGKADSPCQGEMAAGQRG